MSSARYGYLFFGLVILASVMLVITGLLIIEYRFFVRQLDELTQLKQEYDNYLLLFKRMILQEENQDLDKEDSDTSEKKKMNTDTIQDNFLLVNRDPIYLQKAARTLSKEYHLEGTGTGVYKQGLPDKSLGRQKKATDKKNRRKRSKKSLRQLTLSREFGGEAQDIAHEMSFAWPIEKKLFWLSYGFGPRKHPSGKWEYHRGIDLAAPTGTPVSTAAAGVVIQACYSGGYGNCVVIAHNKKFATRYAHLSKILVTPGEELAQGDILGKVGATGNVRGKNGSHLHFEIMVYGKRVNPFYFLS
ncbi:MAG: M23 family metallopeptidase [Candidatus Babeliaceae bacterium]|nr:M23 family metallopeptidase [Candidatus Babeliaceae bacterium]